MCAFYAREIQKKIKNYNRTKWIQFEFEKAANYCSLDLFMFLKFSCLFFGKQLQSNEPW